MEAVAAQGAAVVAVMSYAASTVPVAVKHKSEPVRVGTREEGELTVWLITDDAGTRVVINAWSGVGVIVKLGVDDAARLRDGLDVLLRKARDG